MNTKNETLRGNRTVTVAYEDGRTEEITVQQLKLGRYDELTTASAKNPVPIFLNEMALTAAICGRDKKWITGTAPDFKDALTPESYELLRGTAWEVNKHGFFVYLGRLIKQNQEAFEALSPETKKAQMERFLSPSPSPGFPPPRT